MKIIEMATVKQPTGILCNVQSKGNKDNRGDILVFRAFLFVAIAAAESHPSQGLFPPTMENR